MMKTTLPAMSASKARRPALTWFPLLAILAFLGMGLWSCNLSSEGGDDTLTVRLTDTLQAYDSILIVVKTGGTTLDSAMIRPPYAEVVNGKFNAVIELKEKAPANFTLEFTLYKGNTATGRYKVDVTPAGSTTPVPIIPGSGGNKAPTKVVITTLSPMSLVENGQPRPVEAKVEPTEADQGLEWISRNEAVAEVDDNGIVTPGDAGETDIVATSKVDGTLSATLRIKVIKAVEGLQGISVSPTSMSLYAGGSVGRVTSSFKPDGLAAVPVYASDDTAVAEVGSDGRVRPKKNGRAIISASPEGYPDLIAVCTVDVTVDKPVLDVGDNRRVSPGVEVTFTLRVTQKHGGVKALKWDLDGDGTLEGSTTDSTAAPKHTYDGKMPEVTVTFEVEDTEGNRETVTRKVFVGGTAPIVDIIRPGMRDTTVNVTPFLVEYLVDNVKKARSVDLVHGERKLVEIEETGPGGTNRDTVYITLDNVAPKVEITSPAKGLVTNKSSIPVVWTVEGVAQGGRATENLEGRQGPIYIVRDYTDSAGNRGADSVLITRDVDPPSQPVFTAATTASPTRSRRPTWQWTGGGGGRGTFGWFLGNETPVEGNATSYTPAQDLADGDHTLTIYELDSAGNKSLTATRRIRVQTKGPKVVITSPVNGLVTKAASVAVTWTVNDIPQDSLKIENLAGKQGSIRILRSATDSAGNYVADSVFINRDTLAPPAPTFTTQPPAMVNAAHSSPIQWIWTKASAADSFLVTLNGGTPLRQTGTSYTLQNATNQTYFLEVREMDEAGNISPPVSDTLLVDRAAPPAPTVSGITPTATPTWTWSRGANSDGASMFRYKLSTAATYSAETALTSYAPTNLTSGSYTLQVQERDAAGNWSSDGSFAMVVDKTGPSLSISSPTDFGRVCNFNPAVSGTVSDANGVGKVEYRIGNGSLLAATLAGGAWNFTSTSYVTGANTVTVRAEDAYGNPSTTTLTIYKYPNAVFVRKGMAGTGKSWEDAYGELYQALDTSRAAYPAGTEIWVTVGKYDGNPAYEDNEMFLTHSNIKIMGGFSATTPAVDTNNRAFALNSTTISTVWWLGHRLRSTPLTDVVIDGFTIKSDPSDLPGTGSGVGSAITSQRRNGNMTFKHIMSDGDKDMSGTLNIQGNIIILENSEFTNGNTFGDLVNLDGTATIRGCRFANNRGASHIGFTNLTVTLSTFEKTWKTTAGDNLGAHFTFESSSQSLSINNSTVEGGKARINQGSPAMGSLSYSTSNTPPQ